MSTSPVIRSLAEKLDAALRTRAPIPHFAVSESVRDLAEAYAVQSEWTKMRLARGEKIAGRKIGLTAKAVPGSPFLSDNVRMPWAC